MRKISMLLVLILLVCLSVNVSALELIGGLSYNNYHATRYNTITGEDISDTSTEKSGTGYFGEGIFWIKDNIGLGLRLELLEAKGNYHTIKVLTPYGGLVYKLNENIRFNAAIGANSLTLYDEGEPLYKASGVGFLVGATFLQQLRENLSLNLHIAYRHARPIVYLYDTTPPEPIIGVGDGLSSQEWIPYDGNEGYDMSGFSFNFGLSYDI